jgi:uncharacterized protein
MASQNRLSQESSPYLLQHSHQAVNWFPWSDEALETARRENKPILLSSGYSACRWCHVMAKEAFEDPVIVQLLNQKFISIKVDREERPEIDALYMQALIAMNGQGGWPLNVILTPTLAPVAGGTYFPARGKDNRPGFLDILKDALLKIEEKREATESDGLKILHSLQDLPSGNGEQESDVGLRDIFAILDENYDREFGGFGYGMKFPEPSAYGVLLRHWASAGSSESMEMFDKSLTSMCQGGMFDHLGGGFHRYAVDRNWTVPHFEKMLCDNGFLARLFLEGFQATKQEMYSDIAQRTFSFVARELTAPEGGFYSSLSAHEDGREGEYYLWDLKEILSLLGPRHAKVVAVAYGITSAGNFNRRNVLTRRISIEKIAELSQVPIFEVPHILNSAQKMLEETRSKRKPPARDEKIIAGWNGLMISAYALGFSVLRDTSYLETATKCAEFIWREHWREGALLRINTHATSVKPGTLEDYAYLLNGYIELYFAGLDSRWIERAVLLADAMIEKFEDETGGFFTTAKDRTDLPVRIKSPADDSAPSAYAYAVEGLIRLAMLVGRESYTQKARNALTVMGDKLQQSPAAYHALLSAKEFLNALPTEIILTGDREATEFKELQAEAFRDYRPNKIVVWRENAESEEMFPLAVGKHSEGGKPAVYLCQTGTCHPPVQSAKALQNILSAPQEIRLNIFDEEKYTTEMNSNENAQFLGVMSNIFKQSGLGG